MNNYEITLPDGRMIHVDAPDEAGARQAATNFMMREPAKKKGEAGGTENFGRSFTQGATFNTGDEIAAGVRSMLPQFSNWMMSTPEHAKGAFGRPVEPDQTVSTAPTFDARYGEELGKERAQNQGYAEAHPVADTAGKVTGAIATLPLLPKWLLAGSKGLLAGTARAGATGAGFGAATGFGEGEGGLENRLVNAGKDAVIGGAVGGALHPLAMGLGTLGNMAAESGRGRYVTNAVGGGYRSIADMLDRAAPKMTPRSVSAAAPEGGQLPVSGFLADTADALRSAAPSSANTLEDAAARRIADRLQRGGSTAADAQTRLGELGEGAMPADINPMTQRLAQTAYISPGGAPKVINEALDARNRATPARFLGAMGDEANAPSIYDAQRFLTANKQAVGNESFGAMSGLKQSTRLMEMYENPEVKAAMDSVMAKEANSRIGMSRAPASPVEIMHEVKRAIQNLGIGADGKPAPGAFWWQNAANEFVSELKRANPTLAAADKAYQHAASLYNSRTGEGILTKGQNFMRAGTTDAATDASPAALAADMVGYTPAQALTFKVGSTNTLRDVASQGPDATRRMAKAIDQNQLLRDKLVEIYGPEKAAGMIKRSQSELAFAGSNRVIRGGSDSMQKAAAAADEALSGGMPSSTHGFVNSALGKIADIYNRGRAGNESVREQIAKQLTSMDPVANAELLDRIQRILAQGGNPRTIQRGVAFGATQRPE